MMRLVPVARAQSRVDPPRAKETAERKASGFSEWANENPWKAMAFAVAPTAGYMGYASYTYPGLRWGEKLSRTGLAGNAALLASLVGVVSIFWVWEAPRDEKRIGH